MAIKYKEPFVGIVEAMLKAYQKPLFKMGFADTTLITNWRTIVGEEYYAQISPYRIAKTQKGEILYITAKYSGFAHRFAYIKASLINHINCYLPGNNQLADIKLTTNTSKARE